MLYILTVSSRLFSCLPEYYGCLYFGFSFSWFYVSDVIDE